MQLQVFSTQPVDLSGPASTSDLDGSTGSPEASADLLVAQGSGGQSNSPPSRAHFLDGLRFICSWIVVNQHFTNTFFPFESGDAENGVNYKYLDNQSVWRTT